jgi:sugar lactone lactonase YvrE
VWDPANGEQVLRLPEAGPYPIALHEDRVAWCEATDCGRQLRVTDVAAGRELTVNPPEGYRLTGGADGAFSPDGRYVALSVIDEEESRRVAVVDLTTRRMRVIRGVTLAAPPAWAPSSDRLFLIDNERKLAAYRPDSEQIETVASGLPDFIFDLSSE